MDLEALDLMQLINVANEKNVNIDGLNSKEEIISAINSVDNQSIQQEIDPNSVITAKYDDFEIQVPISLFQDFGFGYRFSKVQQAAKTKNNADMSFAMFDFYSFVLGDQFEALEKQVREKYGSFPIDVMNGLFESLMKDPRVKN